MYKNSTPWDKLSMAERSDVMNLAIKQGITNLNDIRATYNSFGNGGDKKSESSYIHDVLPELLRKAGLNIRVTSGYRPAGAVGTAGSKSWHPRHGAVDIVPQGNTTFEDIERVVTTNPEIVRYMTSNGFGFLDETNRTAAGRALMKKTGATGNHFHFGKDTSARNRYQKLLGNTQVTTQPSVNTVLGPSTAAIEAQSPQTYILPTPAPVQVYTPNPLPTPNFEAIEDFYKTTAEKRARREALTSMLTTQQPVAYTPQVQVPQSFLAHPIFQAGNAFGDGGSIHIKPSHRGRLTELKKRTGKSEAELYNDGNPAHKKMVVFARNARKWKHADGGPLVDTANQDRENSIWQRLKSAIDVNNYYRYRGRPGEKTRSGKIIPKRIRENSSPTKAKSTQYEDIIRDVVVSQQEQSGGSNPAFDIPYLPEKSILLEGSTTSTNALDSLAKYAGIYNRSPQLSEKPIKRRNQYDAPRRITLDEMLGLAVQETHAGATPHANSAKSNNPRALANSNFFTAYGFIPADDFVNDYHYNDVGVSRSVPPLLDAFQYFAQGDYNRGDPNHTKDVNNAGKRAWKNSKVKEWWETSGKYWYETGQGPK